MRELSGTKESIFDTFLEMTAAFGYENVSIRDIAAKVGINSASIYHHFESKEKLLQYAYDYHLKYQYDNRKSVDEMKNMLKASSPDEIIRAFAYTFESDDLKKYTRMILIVKIIYMRIFQEQKARVIFLEQHANNVEFISSVLKHGVHIGLIDPNFDIEAFAQVFVGSLEAMGMKAFAEPSYSVGQLEHEKLILKMVAQLYSTALVANRASLS